MSNMQPGGELSVDRREETLVTQQPGYAATEQVVVDVAAQRRLGLFQFTRILMTILGVLELLLGIRFVLKLIAANPDSGFAQFIYGISGLFVEPFKGLVGTPAAGGTTLEVTTLIAMVLYALLFWIIMRIIPIVVDRPSARTVSRSVREQTPGGADHTTHTTIS